MSAEDLLNLMPRAPAGGDAFKLAPPAQMPSQQPPGLLRGDDYRPPKPSFAAKVRLALLRQLMQSRFPGGEQSFSGGVPWRR